MSRVLPLRALGQPRVAAASLALLVALFALRAATWPVGDPDVWWIAAAGRDLFHGLRPPTVNGWSLRFISADPCPSESLGKV